MGVYWSAEAVAQERENLRILNLKLDELVSQRTRELHDSNAFMENFNTVVAKDLRAPLNAANDYLSMLADRNRTLFDAVSQEYIREMTGRLHRVRSMIDSLLDYSQLRDASHLHTNVDTNFILTFAVRRQRAAIQESDAQIESDDLPVVSGDEGQLITVFTNLISNAIKYRREVKPVIHITAHKLSVGDRWRFAFADNGLGIDAQDQPHLFEFFTRFHSAESNAGMGMGLAICKRIVELHGGDIWVESVPGVGSTFFFTLNSPRF